MIVLAIVAVALLAAAGTFGGLYFGEKAAHHSTSDKLAEKETALGDKSRALTESENAPRRRARTPDSSSATMPPKP